MKRIVYITKGKAMSLVFESCRENTAEFAKVFNAIVAGTLEFKLKSGYTIARHKFLTGEVKYKVIKPDPVAEALELEAEIQESESEAKTLAMWDNI